MSDFLARIPSPNHPLTQFDGPHASRLDLNVCLDTYPSDSFCVVVLGERVVMARDWPRNVRMCYWKGKTDGPRRLVSGNIDAILNEIPNKKPSAAGLNLYFSDREFLLCTRPCRDRYPIPRVLDQSRIRATVDHALSNEAGARPPVPVNSRRYTWSARCQTILEFIR